MKKQEERDLTRFDLDFDIPERFLPEFPPAMFLTTRKALALMLPGPGSIYVSQTLSFTAPVSIGDTVTAICTITDINHERRRVTLKTQCLSGDTVVIDGEAVVSVPRRTPK